MKKVIEGKRYDTETADEIGLHSYLNSGDFHCWYETLYRTQKGTWFIVGGGGALSRYGASGGGSGWGTNNNFRVLTRKEAMEWLEEYGKTKAIEKYFGKEIEDA